jgi:hypothetical protein
MSGHEAVNGSNTGTERSLARTCPRDRFSAWLHYGGVDTSRWKASPSKAEGEQEFHEWTADEHLRLSKFVGSRHDKQAKDVRRE